MLSVFLLSIFMFNFIALTIVVSALFGSTSAEQVDFNWNERITCFLRLGECSEITTSSPKTMEAFAHHESHRLPDDVRPFSYNLLIDPDLEKGTFKGRVIITLNVITPTKVVTLNSHSLVITEVMLNSDPEEKLFLWVDLINQHLFIKKETPFRTGDRILITYNGDMKNRIVGLYSSKYTSENGRVRTIATTKFEPTYARQAFPCFDEPNFKATFQVGIIKPKEYVALSNYPVKDVQPIDVFTDLVTFEKTVPMSTYLTCFIVSDFSYIKTTFKNGLKDTELRVYASPGNLEKTRYAMQIAKIIIEYYINYFNIPYPLPKLDMVAVPDFVSGAMEHWGLVTYRETALLFSSTSHSSRNQQRVASVVAHELAHSWFGNLVTMNWWNDLWLNEGFATYIQYKGVDAAEPSWQMMTQFQTSELHPVMSTDATLSSHPVVMEVNSPDQITAIFDTISYNKGASILRMLEATVGEEKFRKAVTNYLHKYNLGNAVTQNFLDEIQAVVDLTFNVSVIIDTFTIQMGYPILKATFDKVTDTYTLTQRRFMKDPNTTYDESVKYGYKWSIPITYITDLGKSEDLMVFPFDQKTFTVKKPANTKWFKFNYDQVGYYRVNYEESEWRHLIGFYRNLSVTDRTHLLEETFSLAEASQLSYSVPLDLTQQLHNEVDYPPWKVAISELSKINMLLKESDENKVYKELKVYLRHITSNAVVNFTWLDNQDDFWSGHLRRLTREMIISLACEIDLPECLDYVQKHFKIWLSNPTILFNHDVRSLFYKFGMKDADEDTWDKLLAHYKSVSDPSERLKLMNGLANVHNSTLLIRLLEMIKDESLVRSQDYFLVLGYISKNPIGTELVWDYVRENWKYLVDRFTLNDRYLGTMISTITSSFKTEEKLNEMEKFFAAYPEAGAGGPARNTALETVRNNIKWIKNHKSTVEHWIMTRRK